MANLAHRLARLELQRRAADFRMVLRPGDRRPAGGNGYVLAPMPCATSSEWLANYGPEAQHGKPLSETGEA